MSSEQVIIAKITEGSCIVHQFVAILSRVGSVVAPNMILHHAIDFLCDFLSKITFGVYTPLKGASLLLQLSAISSILKEKTPKRACNCDIE